ncbi:hypothetical protein GCM10011519_12960 [Marmoricola endophyticus]|uniref:Uncharacterized protein n=1 Tax=Marmoricola endophyticus TaxID=2040280 RepID=A0A917BIG2_9ACTN|nr:hypothetical protein [Marmoricola endophyticus]GGF40683.1 hypothetical protein GCM10011519_12960 [Marmoricola endophyticus]
MGLSTGFTGGVLDVLLDGAGLMSATAEELRDVVPALRSAAAAMAGSGTGPAAVAAERFLSTCAALVAEIVDQTEALGVLARAGGEDLAAATGQGITRAPA